MYNVPKLLSAALLAATVCAACSSGEKDRAQTLLTLADAAFQSHDYPAALAALDSIDSSCPGATEIRREAMSLRPKVIEGATLRALESCDSSVVALTLSADSAASGLTRVNDAFEGYFTSSALAGKTPEKTGIYPRMSPDGVFTLVVVANPAVDATSVSIASDNSVVTSGTVAKGERNDTRNSIQTITFTPAEADTIGKFALEVSPEAPLTLTFNGGKKLSAKLSKEESEALRNVYAASLKYAALRKATLEHTRLERILETARSQMARTYKAD